MNTKHVIKTENVIKTLKYAQTMRQQTRTNVKHDEKV